MLGMSSQWLYAGLTVLSTFTDLNGNEGISVALITDAHQVRVIKTWNYSPQSPERLFAAMDEAGKEGWIIGPPSWVPFNPNGGRIEIRIGILPVWIRAATNNVTGLGGWASGYTHYPLRRAQS